MGTIKSKSLSPLFSPVVHLIVYLAFFPKKSRDYFLMVLIRKNIFLSSESFLKHPVLILQMQYILLPFRKHLRWIFFKFFHLSSVPNSSGFVRLCWLWLSLLRWSFPPWSTWPHVPGTHLCVWASWVPQAGPLSGGSERSLMSGLVALSLGCVFLRRVPSLSGYS